MNIYMVFLTVYLLISVIEARKHYNDTCPITYCTLEYSPRCGRRMKNQKVQTFTFFNQCQFDQVNCLANPPYEFVKLGECEDNPTSFLSDIPL
ncbi:hypothetical protein O3M35_009250 [Rhynocoris fuscipes]|uniref:Kazal-like domain-containing protein n=1 Tax=Rhynocoris fuscipes TaxID=488301 RepID=A0AAW1D866_9HEMI